MGVTTMGGMTAMGGGMAQGGRPSIADMMRAGMNGVPTEAHSIELRLGSTLAPKGSPEAYHTMPTGAQVNKPIFLQTPEPGRRQRGPRHRTSSPRGESPSIGAAAKRWCRTAGRADVRQAAAWRKRPRRCRRCRVPCRRARSASRRPRRPRPTATGRTPTARTRTAICARRSRPGRPSRASTSSRAPTLRRSSSRSRTASRTWTRCGTPPARCRGRARWR